MNILTFASVLTFLKTFNTQSILPTICTLLALGVGSFVLSRNPKSPVNRSYFGFSLSIAAWMSYYYIGSNLDPNAAGALEVFRRISYSGVTFIGITMFAFIVYLFNYEKLILWSKFNMVFGVISVVLLFKTNYIIAGVYNYSWGAYPKAGPWHPWWLVYYMSVIVMAEVLSLLIILNKKKPYKVRNQAKYVLGAFFMMVIAAFDFVPNYGIDFFKRLPTGVIPTTLCFLGFGFAILKYNLMDISIVIRMSIIYSIVITVVTSGYLITVRVSEQIFQTFLGYNSVWGSMSITLVIAVLFNPLKNRIEDFVERLFFRGTTAEIAKQNAMLRLQVEQAERYKTMADLTSGIIKEVGKPLKALKESDADLDRHMGEPAFMQTYARREQQEIEKINFLLEHLTNYSNPTQTDTQDTNIHKLLNEVVGMTKVDLTEKNIMLVKEFKADEDIQLKVDPSQLRQAFSNIITNATEAMAGGGKLHIITEVVGDVFRISFKDSGQGISKEDIEKIFDPFFTRKEGHTGLGLSVARGIIENHQGKIRVRSEPGFLTEFIMELPLPG